MDMDCLVGLTVLSSLLLISLIALEHGWTYSMFNIGPGSDRVRKQYWAKFGATRVINSVGLELMIEGFVRIDTSVPSGMRTLSTSTHLFDVSGKTFWIFEDSSDGLYN